MEKIEEEKTNKHTQRINTKNDKPRYGIACNECFTRAQINSIQFRNQIK